MQLQLVVGKRRYQCTLITNKMQTVQKTRLADREMEAGAIIIETKDPSRIFEVVTDVAIFPRALVNTLHLQKAAPFTELIICYFL